MPAYWLFKTEPEVFSWDMLKARGKKGEAWDGVRNFQARNTMLAAAVGDRAFFYHSNAKPPGIAGLCEVVATNVVDPTQFDEASHYYDATSPKDNPRWHTIKVKFVEKFPNFLSLDELRDTFTGDELIILRKGSRLSVTPVDDTVAAQILQLARGKA